MTSVEVQKLHTFTGHRDGVYTVVGGDQPSRVFSAAGDGMVVSWDLSSPGEGQLIAKLPSSVYALHHYRDVLIAGQNFEGIHLLDYEKHQQLASLKTTKAAIFDLQSFASSLFIASGEGAFTVVDMASLTVKSRQILSSKSARTIAVGHDAIAVGYSDNFIRIFDLHSHKLKKEYEAHTNSVFTLRYSPDGRFLLSGSRDARLKAWDVASDYRLAQEVVAHMYAINSISFSPDGKHFVTCSLDKSIKLWDADQLRLLKVIDKARHAGHGTSVNKLLWTAYESQLVSASDDRTISVWNFIF